MRKLSSLFVILSIILAVASAYTSAPKATGARDEHTWQVFIGTGYSGNPFSAYEVVQADLPHLPGWEEVPYEELDTLGEQGELDMWYCSAGMSICLIMVEFLDDSPWMAYVFYGEFFPWG